MLAGLVVVMAAGVGGVALRQRLATGTPRQQPRLTAAATPHLAAGSATTVLAADSAPVVGYAPPTRLERPGGGRELRVCADPNNLPFSNARGEGFENRLAELVARELGATVRYTWWAQRRGFARNTLNARVCDLVMGVPSSYELAWPTRPYYRSTYVFVVRKDRGLRVRSFDDAVLRRPGLRIGVQVIGDDYANTPPAHALARRGLGDHVVGYTVYGDYAQPNPPARVVEAVARGEVDVAVVWGPLAGYFAPRQPVSLELTPVAPQIDPPFLPFVFDIAMATRRGDSTFRGQLERILVARRPAIDSILAEYGVPRVDVGAHATAPDPAPDPAFESALDTAPAPTHDLPPGTAVSLRP
ncbi:MAG TPA: substrate-binding domain-containing protein [Gemmatimonadales bacterium]|nr:substrate-binding domain-containing protein [Gemmatimonadales bacterium]